jgi:DNA-directed RNA polymerase III subunit RPC6
MASAKEIENLSDILYKKVSDASTDAEGIRSKAFNQDELLSLGEIASARDLMPLIQYLTNHGLFRTVRLSGKLGWTARPREAAKQIIALDRDEKTIYEIIEEAHTTGIWTRDIKKKTSVAQTAVGKALTKMEKGNLIKSIKSIKAPAQRTYMLAHLQPTEDVTGNSFFDGGDLDESFRDELMNLIVFWVRTQSWAEAPKKKKRPAKAIADSVPDDAILIEDDNTTKKRKRDTNDDDILTTTLRPSTFRSTATSIPQGDTYYPQQIYLSGTHTYPTATAIHSFLTSSDAIKATKAASLTVPEIQNCIDVLCWDDKLERIANSDGVEWGHRTVRGVTFKPPGAVDLEDYGAGNTALTDAPCGRCPVFDVCSEDGPINSGECVYFDQWLRALERKNGGL